MDFTSRFQVYSPGIGFHISPHISPVSPPCRSQNIYQLNIYVYISTIYVHIYLYDIYISTDLMLATMAASQKPSLLCRSSLWRDQKSPPHSAHLHRWYSSLLGYNRYITHIYSRYLDI